MSRSPTITSGQAVSLFTGAGGLDIGCEAAGFSTRAAVEVDEVAQETLLANRRRLLPKPRRQRDFSTTSSTLDFDELLAASQLERGEAALLHGGPPCTPFSKSGYWLAYKRAGEDPKASLLDHYVEALRSDPAEGVSDGERLRTRLRESQPPDPRALPRRGHASWIRPRQAGDPRRRPRRSAASPAVVRDWRSSRSP